MLFSSMETKNGKFLRGSGAAAWAAGREAVSFENYILVYMHSLNCMNH